MLSRHCGLFRRVVFPFSQPYHKTRLDVVSWTHPSFHHPEHYRPLLRRFGPLPLFLLFSNQTREGPVASGHLVLPGDSVAVARVPLVPIPSSYNNKKSENGKMRPKIPWQEPRYIYSTQENVHHTHSAVLMFSRGSGFRWSSKSGA